MTPPAESAHARVLVADDDGAMRTTVAFTLEDLGYEVVEATSGVEVLRMIATAASAGQRAAFDLIIMDIRMPGLSGLHAVRKLRELHWTTPVILMTAFASPETLAEAELLQVPLLSKPFALATLSDLAVLTLRTTAASDDAGRSPTAR